MHTHLALRFLPRASVHNLNGPRGSEILLPAQKTSNCLRGLTTTRAICSLDIPKYLLTLDSTRRASSVQRPTLISSPALSPDFPAPLEIAPGTVLISAAKYTILQKQDRRAFITTTSNSASFQPQHFVTLRSNTTFFFNHVSVTQALLRPPAKGKSNRFSKQSIWKHRTTQHPTTRG